MLTLIFLIAFPFALYKAMKNVSAAKASVNWPTTAGTITASGIKKVMFRRQPQISYTYAVNGTPYTSQRVSFAGGYKPKEVDPVLARYPVGAQVTVAHDPQKPGEATLETGSNKQVTAQVRVLWICFILIVIVQLLNYFLRDANRRDRAPSRTYGMVLISGPGNPASLA
ncbi:MAG TPA: DUF3592 domain-containing protein [Chthoniobacterales bacterium]|nr:DUF3592 domain-containing protein [Chthoniobacterales bacterium]